MSSIAYPRSWARSPASPVALTALLALLYLVIDPLTADLAAQQYRASLGLRLWDVNWYGGQDLPAYSVLFPLLASMLGPRLLGAMCTVTSAWLFERIVQERFGDARERGAGGQVGALWFGVAITATLVTGRLTFALGVALALGAVLAALRARPGIACALAVLTSLASPVAGAFVALIAAAWWLADRRIDAVWLGAGALAPIAVVALIFPEGGDFPFVPSSFWPTLAAVVVVAIAIPREERTLRIGAVLYGLATVASFVLDTPMGGNVVRLGALLAGPLLACALWTRDRRRLALLALPLLYWQWVAPVDDLVRAANDRSTQGAYYAGLLSFLKTQGPPFATPFRVEIPFTDNHWEARYVTAVAPLARGWERQLDRQRNGLFYDRVPLTAERYRRWLDDNAVRFVALADAPVDYSAAAEARLVRSRPAYLRQVWHDAHWRVYQVADARPLARGAVTVTALDSQAVSLWAHHPGTATVRVRYTRYLRLAGLRGCVAPAPGGWTRVRVDRIGPAQLVADFTPERVLADGPRCTD
jgi:hypothetical protein